MRLFVPVMRAGIDAPLSDHFGKAPVFAILDLEAGTADFTMTPPRDTRGCGWRRLQLSEGDAVLCRHIGGGALNGLAAAGVRVLRTDDADLPRALQSFGAGRLEPMPTAAALGCGCTH